MRPIRSRASRSSVAGSRRRLPRVVRIGTPPCNAWGSSRVSRASRARCPRRVICSAWSRLRSRAACRTLRQRPCARRCRCLTATCAALPTPARCSRASRHAVPRPVRVVRDSHTLMSTHVHGVYPCGEGAGYAGGIMSAALDGIRVASAVKNLSLTWDSVPGTFVS